MTCAEYREGRVSKLNLRLKVEEAEITSRLRAFLAEADLARLAKRPSTPGAQP